MTPSPQKWWQQTDLLSGLIAAGALVALVFLLHMVFPLALGLAALTYFGVLLATRRTPVAVPDRQGVYETLVALDGLSRQVPFAAPRQQAGAIVGRARDILNYLSSHPDSDAQWQDYIRECLDSALAGTRQFVALAPHLAGASDPPVQKYSEFLTTLAQTLDGVWNKLIGDDTASFESQMDGYKSTLQEINQVYLGGDATK